MRSNELLSANLTSMRVADELFMSYLPFSESVNIIDAFQKPGEVDEINLIPGADHIVQRPRVSLPKAVEFFKKHLRINKNRVPALISPVYKAPRKT